MRYSKLDIHPYSFLFENLNEGLIRSYDIETVLKHLKDDAVSTAEVCQNPYFSKDKTYSKDEFVRVYLKPDKALSYKAIVDKVHNLYGWFTGIIEVSLKTKTGYKPYAFFRGEPYRKKEMHDFDNCFFSEDTDYELEDFVKMNLGQIERFVLIIEEKFPIREYVYSSDEVFYHETKIDKLSKIMKDGLTPKSYFNYPLRIYLTNDLEEFEEMVLNCGATPVILKIRLMSDQKIYHDPRSNGFFTYDNISPKEIISVFDM